MIARSSSMSLFISLSEIRQVQSGYRAINMARKRSRGFNRRRPRTVYPSIYHANSYRTLRHGGRGGHAVCAPAQIAATTHGVGPRIYRPQHTICSPCDMFVDASHAAGRRSVGVDFDGAGLEFCMRYHLQWS